MLLPLAAIALFATSSFFGPASVLFRSIRRVVQPRTRAEPSEDETAAVKAANFFHALFLRAFASVASTSRSSPATLLPVFRGQVETPVLFSRSLHEETPVVNMAAVDKVEVAEPASTSTAAAESNTAPIALLPARPQHRTQRVPLAPSVCVEFTIGWDDVWPQSHRCVPQPHMKYTFNSYYNAFTISPSQRSMSSQSPSVDASSDDSDSDSDSDWDALELASRSADDDLLWAFHSLHISDTSSSSAHSLSPCNSAFEPSPAGLSPFCPPPPLTPNPPPPTATTWRLEWY
ncbi:hypothetical protein C8R45DRAFT_313223 [Mycena sanguinolenta]|nr:hypothetical protein C8R45DRAFT_313223 [Mycena sanguinolenta]